MSSQNGNSTDKHPLVSVVLPVYNGEKYIRQAIISVLDQEYSNLELILIDDGSTDNTRTLYTDIPDDRMLVIRFEQNKGLIAALNTGIEKSKGKYIARMDSDDISFPNRIAEQVKFMENNIQVGVLGSSFIIDRDGKKRQRPVTTGSDRIKANFLFRNSINHPTVMIRKKLLEISNCRYRSTALHAEDLDLWIRLAPFTEFENLEDALVMYRAHAGQVSVQQAQKQRETIIETQKNLLRELAVPYSEEELNLHISLYYREFAKSNEYLAKTGTWLERIIKANREVKLFNQNAIEEVSGNLWFLACTTLAGEHVRTSGIYKQFSLHQYYRPSTSSRIRFFIKNLKAKK